MATANRTAGQYVNEVYCIQTWRNTADLSPCTGCCRRGFRKENEYLPKLWEIVSCTKSLEKCVPLDFKRNRIITPVCGRDFDVFLQRRLLLLLFLLLLQNVPGDKNVCGTATWPEFRQIDYSPETHYCGRHFELPVSANVLNTPTEDTHQSRTCSSLQTAETEDTWRCEQ